MAANFRRSVSFRGEAKMCAQVSGSQEEGKGRPVSVKFELRARQHHDGILAGRAVERKYSVLHNTRHRTGRKHRTGEFRVLFANYLGTVRIYGYSANLLGR